jgi:hypothetical protein
MIDTSLKNKYQHVRKIIVTPPQSSHNLSKLSSTYSAQSPAQSRTHSATRSQPQFSAQSFTHSSRSSSHNHPQSGHNPSESSQSVTQASTHRHHHTSINTPASSHEHQHTGINTQASTPIIHTILHTINPSRNPSHNLPHKNLHTISHNPSHNPLHNLPAHSQSRDPKEGGVCVCVCVWSDPTTSNTKINPISQNKHPRSRINHTTIPSVHNTIITPNTATFS